MPFVGFVMIRRPVSLCKNPVSQNPLTTKSRTQRSAFYNIKFVRQNIIPLRLLFWLFSLHGVSRAVSDAWLPCFLPKFCKPDLRSV